MRPTTLLPTGSASFLVDSLGFSARTVTSSSFPLRRFPSLSPVLRVSWAFQYEVKLDTLALILNFTGKSLAPYWDEGWKYRTQISLSIHYSSKKTLPT